MPQKDMKKRVKPERIGIKARGKIIEINKDTVLFKLSTKKEHLKNKIYEIKNEKENYFNSGIIVENSHINMIFLNRESLLGLYENQENNLPYEIINNSNQTVYRQSTIERKENIYERLEQIAKEEKIEVPKPSY